MTKSNSINHLHQQGLSQREIATAVNVDRKTVRRHLATEITGSDEAGDPKGTTAPTGSDQTAAAAMPAKSGSSCEPFREAIEEMLTGGLSAQRIFQDLQVDHAFAGSYWSVRRFVKKLRTEKPTAFRRIEVEPGWEAQVDFGDGAPVIGKDGKRRRTHVLRVVLSHSRKGYSEVFFAKRPTTSSRRWRMRFGISAACPRRL